jgi:ribosomal protein S18 acetylase RimI-like enzyme
MTEGDSVQVDLREFQYPQDYLTVVDLWRRAGPGIHLRRSDEPEEILKKLTRDPDLFLVAVKEGAIVGTVLGGFDGRRGLVYHLAVEPHLRQHGIGDRLMKELETRLKRKGCLRCYLLVTKDNQEAMEFYTHRGWDAMDLQLFGKNLA